MSASSSSRKLTYSEYLEFTPPDSAKYQLIQGELVSMTSPSAKHQSILLNLVFLLQSYLRNNPVGKLFLAPMDVVLGETNIVQPDLFFLSNDKLNQIQDSCIQGPPDFIIEILSPSTAYYDLVVKKKIYEKSSVSEYWIVDPQMETLDVFCLKNQKYEPTQQIEKQGKVSSLVLTGFTLDARDIFN